MAELIVACGRLLYSENSGRLPHSAGVLVSMLPYKNICSLRRNVHWNSNAARLFDITFALQTVLFYLWGWGGGWWFLLLLSIMHCYVVIETFLIVDYSKAPHLRNQIFTP